MALRVPNSTELGKLRASGDACQIFLGIPDPATVLEATVSAAPASNDQVGQVSWTITSGSYANCKPDMTCLVGTAAGLADVGVVRVRKAPTSTILYVGETSEIHWEEGLFLTVLADFGAWARHVRTPDDHTVFMDFDVAYTNQHSVPDPVVNMGPDAVLWLDEVTGEASISFDASTSFVVIGSIASYAYSAPGAHATTGLYVAAVTVTYNVAGTYLVYCTVTTAAGKTWQGVRTVLVYDKDHMPLTDFTLSKCTGDLDAGGWSFEITVYQDVSHVRERARVILFSKDWYAGQPGSLGPVSGRENIICQGWITKESIDPDPHGGAVTFTVEGPAHWLGLGACFLAGVNDTDFADGGGGAPNEWIEMQDLTTTRALWCFIHDRMTIDRILDINLLVDTRQVGQAAAVAENLWQQFLQMSEDIILAKPCFDRYGTLFVDYNQHYLLEFQRAALTIVMDLTEEDKAEWSFEHRIIPEAYKAEVSGMQYINGKANPIGAISPGKTPRSVGRQALQFTELAMGTQAQALEWAGWIAGAGAGEIGPCDVDMGQNNRFMDVTPPRWVRATLQAGDSPRGIALINHRFIPLTVEHTFNDKGYMETALNLDGEGRLLDAIEMEFPGENVPPITPPQEPPQPPEPPGGDGGGDDEPGVGQMVVSEPGDVITTTNLDDSSPTWSTELGGEGPAAIVDNDLVPASATIYTVIESETVWVTEDLT